MNDLKDTLGLILFGVFVLTIFLGGGAALGYFLLPLFFGRDLVVPLTLGGVLLGALALYLFFLWSEANSPMVLFLQSDESYESRERYHQERQRENFENMSVAFYGIVAFFVFILLVGWVCRSSSIEPKSVWGVAGTLAGFVLSLYLMRAMQQVNLSSIWSKPQDALERLTEIGVLSPEEAQSLANALSTDEIYALPPKLQEIAIAFKIHGSYTAQSPFQRLPSAFFSVIVSDIAKVETFLRHHILVWVGLGALSYIGLIAMYKFAPSSPPLWYVYLSWGLAFAAGTFLSMCLFPLCADEEGKWEIFLVWIGGIYFADLLAYSVPESASAIGGLTGFVLAGLTFIYRLLKGWQKEAAKQREAEIQQEIEKERQHQAKLARQLRRKRQASADREKPQKPAPK